MAAEDIVDDVEREEEEEEEEVEEEVEEEEEEPHSAQTVKDVAADAFVKEYAKHLKQADKLQLPPWCDTVKTACWKELAPLDSDWYYTRAASVARRVYLKKGLGVGKLRKVYGGSSNNGTCPEHHAKAAGGLIRHILQELERVGIVEKCEKGRSITPAGQRDLDLIASRVPMTKIC